MAAIGVDLGGTKIRAGRIRVDGSIEREVERATDTSSADAIIAQIVHVVGELSKDGPVDGVGIGLPGTIDQRSGTLVEAVNLPLHDVPVRDRLEEALGMPVAVDNDGNCAALGEHRFGAARGTSDSVTLTLGTGVGGGIVVGGDLLRGPHGTGAELGHMVIALNGRPCQGDCPGRGHVEAYCSGTALGLRARDHGLADARAVLAAAASGDPIALGLLAEVGDALGAALVSLAAALAPEVFVIGGGLGAAAAPFLLERATAILRVQALPPNGEARVVPAALGNDAGMVGAAALVR